MRCWCRQTFIHLIFVQLMLIWNYNQWGLRWFSSLWRPWHSIVCFFFCPFWGKGNSISWNCKHNKNNASTLLQKRSVNKMLCSFLDSVHYVSLKNSWICQHNKESVIDLLKDKHKQIGYFHKYLTTYENQNKVT